MDCLKFWVVVLYIIFISFYVCVLLYYNFLCLCFLSIYSLFFFLLLGIELRASWVKLNTLPLRYISRLSNLYFTFIIKEISLLLWTKSVWRKKETVALWELLWLRSKRTHRSDIPLYLSAHCYFSLNILNVTFNFLYTNCVLENLFRTPFWYQWRN